MQILSRSENIAVFTGTARAGILCKLKCLSVSHTQPVIDREHNEAAADQILIGSVIVRIFPAIVPAQHHLSWTAAVDVDDGGFGCDTAGRLEELSVSFDSIAGAEADEFRCHQLRSWKIGRQPFAGSDTRGPAGYGDHCWGRWALSARTQVGDRLAVGRAGLTTGAHSMPVPLVSGVGVAALIGTLKR